MADIIAIQLQHKQYEAANPTLNSKGIETGEEFHEFLYGFPLPPSNINPAFKLRFTVSEIREDNISGLESHSIEFEFDATSLLTSIQKSTSNFVNPGGIPATSNAILLQHIDATTTNHEGAATFAFEVPEYVDSSGNRLYKDADDIATNTPSDAADLTKDLLFSFNSLLSDNKPSLLQLKIEQTTIKEDGSIGNYEIISNQAISYVKISVDNAGDVFKDLAPYDDASDLTIRGNASINLTDLISGTQINLGTGETLPQNKDIAKDLVEALHDEFDTLGITFYDTDNDPPKEAVILSPQTRSDLDTLFKGESIGFKGMENLLSQYVDISDPSSIDCESVAEDIIQDIITSGKPIPGFPNGLNVNALPKPKVEGLVPPKLLKLIESVMNVLDMAAQAASIPTTLPRLIEDMKRKICEQIRSMIAAEQLKQAKNICLTLPLRPDLLGATSEATLKKEIKIILCSDTFNIGEVLTAITPELVHGLTADSPDEFSLEDRIEQITLMDAEQLKRQLQKAIDDGKVGPIPDPKEMAKVVRQLGALVANPANTPKCKIEQNSNAHDLIKQWADYSGDEEIEEFWKTDAQATPALKEGHLELVLCFLTKGHQPLIDAVLADIAAPKSVASIADFSREKWTSYFFPCIPLCTQGKNIESRVNNLLREAAKVNAKHADSSYLTFPALITDLTGEKDTNFIAAFEAALANHFGSTPPITNVAFQKSQEWERFFLATCVNDDLLPEAFNPMMAEDRFSVFCKRLEAVEKQHSLTPFSSYSALLVALAKEGNSTPHQPLIDAINPSFASSVTTLFTKTKEDWRNFFFNPSVSTLFPAFTDTTSHSLRLEKFMERVETVRLRMLDATDLKPVTPTSVLLSEYEAVVKALIEESFGTGTTTSKLDEPSLKGEITIVLTAILNGIPTDTDRFNFITSASSTQWKNIWDTILPVSPSPPLPADYPSFTSFSSPESRKVAFIDRYNLVVEQIICFNRFLERINEVRDRIDDPTDLQPSDLTAVTPPEYQAILDALIEDNLGSGITSTPLTATQLDSQIIGSNPTAKFDFIKTTATNIDWGNIWNSIYTVPLKNTGTTYQEVLNALFSDDGLPTSSYPATLSDLENAITALVPPSPDLISPPPFHPATPAIDSLSIQEWTDLFCPKLFPPYTRPSNFADLVERLLDHIGQCFPLPPHDCPAPVPEIPLPPTFDCLVDDCVKTIVESNSLKFGSITATTLDNIPNLDSCCKKAILAIEQLFKVTDVTAISPPLRFSVMEALYAKGFDSAGKIAILNTDEFRHRLIGTPAYDKVTTLHANAILLFIGDATLEEYLELLACIPKEKINKYLLELNGATYTSLGSIMAVADDIAFETNLAGTEVVVYAKKIYNALLSINTGGGANLPLSVDGFVPINPDGSLRNCIPPKHLSAIGPVNYLIDMLPLKENSTCSNPIGSKGVDLHTALTGRRGDLHSLEASKNNLEIPIPKIDLVNETLEAVAKEAIAGSGITAGALLNTAPDKVKDLLFEKHPPAKLLCAIPEHSAPTMTTANQSVYDELAKTFNAPGLPYNLQQDVSNAYLGELGVNLFSIKRQFQKEITEFPLAPAIPDTPAANFKSHLWRYPVRIDVAIAYLGISQEEYIKLYDTNANPVFSLYNFKEAKLNAGTPDEIEWWEFTKQLPEFLKRTGLCYDEFIQLWQSDFVNLESDLPNKEFPNKEPHDLSRISITTLTVSILRKLKIFISLWKTLQTVPTANYSFTELQDIVEVLGLYNGNTINDDFIRQLVAFQMMRDDFQLVLKDESDITTTGIGANRLHILALWEGPTHNKWDWAIKHLLNQLKAACEIKFKCSAHPNIVKILTSNLEELSDLVNFDSSASGKKWHDKPSHTIRFTEVLCKIYASNWDVEELRYLFTNSDLDGEAPFLMQSTNEAEKCPFDLPECSDFTLSKLREQLLKVTFDSLEEEEWSSYTWKQIQSKLKTEFCFENSSLLGSICSHFFPKTDNHNCLDSKDDQSWYCISLENKIDTSNDMWDEPINSPFFYDENYIDPNTNKQGRLCFALPLSNQQVIEKIYTDKLKTKEKEALRDLFFKPRNELAQVGFLFPNQLEAIEYLIQEPDADERWQYFQKSFAVFYKRSQIIAQFIAYHVASVDIAKDFKEGKLVMWEILKNLYADENRSDNAHEWEKDDGSIPPVLWNSQAHGGAFAAINGLVGTGLLGEYYYLKDGKLNYDADGNITDELLWREVRGPMTAFGNSENNTNSPVPSIIPPLEWNNTLGSLVSICNGFAIENANGDILGGALPYAVRWRGVLLIHKKGAYSFYAGTPAPENEKPLYDPNTLPSWNITIQRYQQKKIELLSKGFGEDHIPCDCSTAVELLPCAYEVIIDYVNPVPTFAQQEELDQQNAGFQLKYEGPDTEDTIQVLPFHNLYRTEKSGRLSDGLPVPTMATVAGQVKVAAINGQAKEFLDNYYTSTIRDIRRTYQRAFKAGLFARRFALSAEKTTRNQSELSYLLDHGEDFEGTSYYENGGNYVSHKAFFNFNLLPIQDAYQSQGSSYDDRYTPSQQRKWALFDWWERIFDHKQLEKSVSENTSKSLWELYLYENDEHVATDPPEANRLERYLGSNLTYSNINALINFEPSFTLSHADLDNEEWAIRIYQAALALDEIAEKMNTEGLKNVAPAKWAVGADMDKLASFVCKSLLEDCSPPRYEAVEKINNRLRTNARNALVSYLTSEDRVLLLGTKVFATESKHLSELLLMDIEVDICQKASRIEEAVSSVQNYVRRYRLGLEKPDASITLTDQMQFAQLWDKQFATYAIWKMCKLRTCYPENWLEYDKMKEARKTESFRFLEDQLRRQTLTVPIVKALPNPTPANNTGALLLQDREPSITQALSPSVNSINNSRQGFDQIGTPEIHGRSSWLTSLIESDIKSKPPKVPYWIEAAIRLGKKFVRVAAAGQPTNRLYCGQHGSACCEQCIEPHIPLVDEYYFWLVSSKFFEAISQNANWDWHNDTALPSLLQWGSENKVLLAWTKIHNGEFQQLRFSDEGVHVVEGVEPDIEFMGREADTLRFKVSGGIIPVGYPSGIVDPNVANSPLHPEPGFRYLMVSDLAVVVPQITYSLSTHKPFGGLPSFPSFVYFAPGASSMPPSIFSPAMLVAENLIGHCRFELALKTYQQVYNPLSKNNQEAWNNIAQSNENKTVLLHYLETLLQWGDALMKQHSPESFEQARLVFDTACKIMGICPSTILEQDNNTPIPTIKALTLSDKGINPRLLNLYEIFQDRLDLIHHCQNSYRYKNGATNKDMTYFGNSPFKKGWQHNVDICADELDNCLPQSPYRFTFLLQKAQEFAGEVTSLGGALLSAYEKGDGEYLASLRGYHEKQLLELALEIRKEQWRASDWDVQGLYKTKEMAQIRLAYNQELYNGGLNGGESDYVSYTQLSLTELILSKVIELGAQILRGIPDVLAGLPQMHMPLGSKMAGFVSTISQVFSTMSQYHGTYSGLRNTEGGWDRREREWLHQIELITVELQQIERQILASELRRKVALQELNNHVQQIENSKEVFDFMRDKFSNHELYLWMQKETAALHHQMYELALLLARQAERAYNYERGFTTKKFIDGNMIWDNLHEGMLAGERLQHSLRRMEQTYYNENVREYELTKHISLRQHFPLEFLILKETGCCTIDLPEWLFDMDYPGQYMRRIKNVTLSIPCVVGPYTGVHCRLTLLSSRTRTQAHLNKNVDESCIEEGIINNGYPALPDDPRWVHQFIASQAIATSSGQQDSGLFELNFNDERYLPFEYAGAISCWRIELPKENNYFDMDSLGDVIMHVNYMAREGGELLRKAAMEITHSYLPGNGKRLIDVKHELTQAWHQFMNCESEEDTHSLKLELSQQMFPYLPCSQQIKLEQIDVIMEISKEFQQEQFNVDFIPNERVCNIEMANGKSSDFSINCIAATDWKTNCDTNGIYQGTVDIQKAGVLLSGKKQTIGQLRISKDITEIKNFYMILKYSSVD